MRKAYNNVKFIVDNDILIGISLGYDFCAEHEWGIKKLKEQFGVGIIQEESLVGKIKNKIKRTNPEQHLGLPRRMITKGKVNIIEEGDRTFLYSSDWLSWYNKERTLEELLPREIGNNKELSTAWNDSNFCILTGNEIGRKYLYEIKEAFERKDIAFASLDGGPFSNSSLSVIIASRLPEEYVTQMYKVDKKEYDLIEYEKKIGITDLKENTRGKGFQGEKYYMACSPNWICYEDEEEREKIKQKRGTKYDIWYWVNYSDDDSHYGWHSWFETYPNSKRKEKDLMKL